MASIDLDKSIRITLKNSLGIKPKEHLLIVTESSLHEFGEKLWKSGRKLTNAVTLMRYSPPNSANHKLPTSVYSALQHSDAFVILSPHPLNEKLLNDVQKNGARFLAFQNTNKELLERTLKTNYKKISNLSRKIAELFSIGRNITITSPTGTEVQVSISKNKGIAETGLVHKPKEFSFLPAGEACLNLNKNIEGRIVLDRIVGHKKKLATPITLNVNHGHVTQIKGKKEAQALRKDIRKFGKNGRNLYQIGIGTNNNVSFGHSKEEDEKVCGTIHISLGQDRVTKVKGKITPAIKGVILKPTVEIDGRMIIDKGQIAV